MQIGPDCQYHLTYCSNIHPSNGWEKVMAALGNYAPALKARLAPNRLFGIGLRLSGQESSELLEGDRLQRLRAFLDEHDLYVFTLNGFPYGPFHQQPVKADVHVPDWRSEERVQYTLRLIAILAALLPSSLDGSISTSPLSYKRWVLPGDTATWQVLTRNIVRVAAALVKLHREHGKLLHVDLEPEPDGLLENGNDVLLFFRDWLLRWGAELLSKALAVTVFQAQELLLRHIRICMDTCHVAVAYEQPAELLDRFTQLGIFVGKVQISSALRMLLPPVLSDRTAIAHALRPFAESTYLHQVVQRNRDGSYTQYPDLPDALTRIDDMAASEWRIHFHVPIFVGRYDLCNSTQDAIFQTFDLLAQKQFCHHLEIETYTWEVLPPQLKLGLLESIHREYLWVLDVIT